jgi:hypothetical protein
MSSTAAYTGRTAGDTTSGHSLFRTGIVWGIRLAALPPLVTTTVPRERPELALQILGAETVLIAIVQVAISIAATRKSPTPRVAVALVPAVLAGLIVAVSDIVSFSLAIRIPEAPDVLTIVAYDVGLGLVLALPLVVVVRAAAHCRLAAPKETIDASPKSLLRAYGVVLTESARGPRWQICGLLTHHLIRRHIRRTLEGVQRGYALLAVKRRLSAAENRDRRMIDDYLLSVPPVSRLVPIPTVATVFVLWKLVPGLVEGATTFATWLGGSDSYVAGLTGATAFIPDEVTSLAVDAFAVAFAFCLLMFVLAPSIRRRDKLLALHEVCEREVVLMDDRLHVRRSSRRLEYFMAGLPALPFALYGLAVLAYALAGLFVYPSPKGPLGGFVERADLMHLGPITGAVLAQAFLVAAAVWIAWIVETRKATRVVLL